MHLGVDGVRDGRLSTSRRVPFLGLVLGLRRGVNSYALSRRHKPAEHHVAMFLHLQTLRCHVLRPVGTGVSLSAVHIFSIFAGEIAEEHCQVVSPISKLTFKVALPPLCCRGNLHSFFMTLFTGRERLHSSARGGGAWGQCCHAEQFRFQTS